MSLRGRIQRLERKLGVSWPPRRAAANPEHRVGTAEDWLADFEEGGRRGYFAGEPDFPVALAEYRDAIAAAKARPDGSPPADFRPDATPAERLRSWQGTHWPKAVFAAWRWLAEINERVRQGRPPVTRAEFRELAAWFERNESRLFPNRNDRIDVDGRSVDRYDLRLGIEKGPKVMGVTDLVEALRSLRGRFGDQDEETGPDRGPEPGTAG
jgi:hypothetical protein